MIDHALAEQLADAVIAARADGAPWPPPAVSGWEHLPVALVDTVFSLQALYSREAGVFPPVERYATWAALRLGVNSGSLLSGIRCEHARPHPVSEMIDLLGPLSTGERVAVFGSRRPAYTRAGAPRRADTVVSAARVLAGLGIENRHDFARRYTDPDGHGQLRAAWRSVPGFGERSWEYIPLLCGLPGVKADVHVTRFVAEAAGRAVTPEAARDLVYAATEELRRREPSPGWTPGGVEHFLWRVASRRDRWSRPETSCIMMPDRQAL